MANVLDVKCGSTKLNENARVSIALYKRLQEFIPTMIEVARKFDGKVINKRLLTAFEKASPTFIDRYERTLPDFCFSYEYGHIRVRFLGEIEGTNDRYYNGYNNEVTFYGYDIVLNSKFDFAAFEIAAHRAISCLDNWIDHKIQLVKNFDRVCEIYNKAYDMLREVGTFRECCQYADAQHNAMRYMKDVYISLSK